MTIVPMTQHFQVPGETATIDLKCKPGVANKYLETKDEWIHTAHQWTVTLMFQKRRMTIPFFLGSGWTNQEPPIKTVLHHLLAEASIGELSYEEYLSEFGLEPMYHKQWKDSCDLAARFRKVLGSDEVFEKVKEMLQDY